MKRLFGRRVPPPCFAAAAEHQRRWTKNLPLGDDMDFGVQPPAYGMQDNPFFATARPTQEGTLPPLKKTMHKPQQTRPGSGAHHAGSIQVPDRLRDSMSYFAADGRRFAPDENQGHSKMQRDSMLRNVMTSHSNMYTHASIDKVKIALEAARRKKHDADEWRTLWTLLRTKHFCVELVKEPTDEMPEGDRLYVDLDTCQERRRPFVWRLDNGTTVVPVFSLEEYVFQYFSRNHVFESEWFPVPRNGTAFESFKKLDFPVLGHGGIHRMAALATMSTPHQFLLCLNPIQPACKFLTYPEMVHISKAAAESKAKHEAATTNMSKIFESRAAQLAMARDESRVVYTHSPTLHRLFDTKSWEGTRLDPATLPLPDPTKAPAQIFVPPIAQDELSILVFDVEDLLAVDMTKEELQDGTTKLTATALLSNNAAPVALDLARTRLEAWSFVSEAESPITLHFVRDTAKGTVEPDPKTTHRVYRFEHGALFRKDCVKVAKTLREELEYDAVLLNAAASVPTPPPSPRTEEVAGAEKKP